MHDAFSVGLRSLCWQFILLQDDTVPIAAVKIHTDQMLSVTIWLAGAIPFFRFVSSWIAQQLKIKHLFTMIVLYHKPKFRIVLFPIMQA